MGTCDPGLTHTTTLTVGEEHTAVEVGSGDVAVLSTPSLLAAAESACVDAIAGDILDGQTSLGIYAEIEHLQASPVGAGVEVEATLIGHHGRRLEFQVIVRDGDDIVGKVRHRRVLVDRAGFLEKAGVAPG